MAMNGHKITIVSCGPGSPDYLTLAARRAIEDAEVLVGAKRLLDQLAADDRERILVGTDIEGVLNEMSKRRGKRIAVLVTGDAGLCSLARPVIKRFGREACEVIPGISSVQAAFARIGVEWYDAQILDAHGKDPEINPASLKGTKKIAVLAGRPESLRWTADLADALGAGHEIFVCEDLTLDNERVRQVSPADLRMLETSSRTIVLLIEKDLLE
ncbi:MAG: precorrin-6y C5,15-methyltransferase (decarboxylating) subunit CbiE [Planctomycetota bacterium]